MTAVERIAARADRLMDSLEAPLRKQIKQHLAQALRTIETDLRKRYGSTLSAVAKETSRPAQEYRARLLYEELRSLLDLLDFEQAPGFYSGFTSAIAKAQTVANAEALEYLTARGAGLFGTAIDEQAAAAVLRGVENSRIRLAEHAAQAQKQIRDAIVQGLLRGDGIGKVIREVRQATQLEGTKAYTLVRTELAAARVERLEYQYRKENINHVQWVATNDERTCSICGYRHGIVYELGSIRAPAHPRCRCTLIPWRKEWQQLGITEDATFKEQREEILTRFAAMKIKPNSGPSQFEEAAGLKPKQVFDPHRN